MLSHLRSLTFIALAALATQARAEDPTPTGPVTRWAYVDHPMDQLIDVLSKQTKLNFVYKKEDVNFRMTYISGSETPLSSLLSAFLMTLRANGLQLYAIDNNLYIFKGDMQGLGLIVGTENAVAVTHAGQLISGTLPPVVTRIFSLHYTKASSVMAILKGLISTGGVMQASEDTRQLIVTDSAANIEKVGQLLESIDKPQSGLGHEAYVLKTGAVETTKATLEAIMAPMAAGTIFTVVPDKAHNTLFLISTPPMLEKAKEILVHLDRAGPNQPDNPDVPDPTTPPTPETRQYDIYKVRYHSADDLKKSVDSVTAKLDGTNNMDNGFVNSMRSCELLTTTNSLLFAGSKASLAKVWDLLQTIDVPRTQVVIEVLVIETRKGSNFALGIDLGGQAVQGNDTIQGGAFQQSSPLKTALSNGLASSLPFDQTSTGTPSAGGLNLAGLGKTLIFNGNTFLTIGALVKALDGKKDTDIILQTRLNAQDSRPATFFDGGKQRILSSSSVQQQSAGNTTTKSFTFEDIGTSLKVTPTIGDGDIVTLQIEQEISSAGESDADGLINTFRTTTMTTAHVGDGEFLIMSGTTRSEKAKTDQRIPCLGGVPFIGGLLGSKDEVGSARHMMIFLRPCILRTNDKRKEVADKAMRLSLDAARKSNGVSEDWDMLTRLLNIEGYDKLDTDNLDLKPEQQPTP